MLVNQHALLYSGVLLEQSDLRFNFALYPCEDGRR